MVIKFDEKTKEEYKAIYNFLKQKISGKIKSFEGELSKDGLPIGACSVTLESSKINSAIKNIEFNIGRNYNLEGVAIVTLNNKQCVNYNFTDDNFAEIEYPTGASYIGSVDKFARHGQGSYTNRDGLQIEGTFADNSAHGLYTIRFKDGESTKATYFQGKLCGVVKKILQKEILLTAVYNKGELVSAEYKLLKTGPKIVFKMIDEIVNPFYTITGNFEMYVNDALVYSGGIENAQKNGNGTYFHSNGDVYSGSYINDKRDGFGTLSDKDGVIIEQGFWKENKYIGETKTNSVAIPSNDSIPSLNPKDSYEIKKLKDAIKNIENNIVGQKNAINQIANNLILAFLCEKDTTKPLSSILMTGPTGVGKTETAKQISRHLFGKEPFCIDFGNFHDDFMISSLIGAPSGYKGYDETPAFLKYLSDNKETGGVILFDELDKADEDCYSVFMRMLDEGEIISARNEVFKVNNFIIIGTTNFTAHHSRALGFSQTKDKDVKDDLSKNNTGLKKEQIARYNIVVEYEELTRENKMDLCKNEIAKTIDKIKNISAYNIDFEINEEIIEKIVDSSNANFGAREIKNRTSKAITTKLAEFIRNNSQNNILVKINSLDDIEIITKEEKLKTKEIVKDN